FGGDATAAPAFVDQGRGLLTEGGRGYIWHDSATGRVVRELNNLAADLGVTPALSPDGNYLATTSPEGAQLWQVATGQRVGPELKNRALQRAYSVCFTPDGR